MALLVLCIVCCVCIVGVCSTDALVALLRAGADVTIANDDGDLPIAEAVRANCPSAVMAILDSCVGDVSRMLLYANKAGDSSVFVAETVNVQLAQARGQSSASLVDSNAIVTALLKALGSSGTPLTSIRHAHDCFARGVVYADKGK